MPSTRRLILAALFVLSGIAMTLGLAAQEKKNESKLLRHVVLFKFKDDVTKDQAEEVANAFAELPKKIKEIVDFEWGTDVSVENLSQGLTHGFLVTFHSEKDRDAYLPHPEHKKFVDLAKPRIEKVVVFDYWAKK
jgi:hypothetical protein